MKKLKWHGYTQKWGQGAKAGSEGKARKSRQEQHKMREEEGKRKKRQTTEQQDFGFN